MLASVLAGVDPQYGILKDLEAFFASNGKEGALERFIQQFAGTNFTMPTVTQVRIGRDEIRAIEKIAAKTDPKTVASVMRSMNLSYRRLRELYAIVSGGVLHEFPLRQDQLPKEEQAITLLVGNWEFRNQLVFMYDLNTFARKELIRLADARRRPRQLATPATTSAVVKWMMGRTSASRVALARYMRVPMTVVDDLIVKDVLVGLPQNMVTLNNRLQGAKT